MLMIGFSSPRDIDPYRQWADDVYLYSIDDLQHVIAGNLWNSVAAAVEAELLVSQPWRLSANTWCAKGQDIQQHRREQAKHHHADMI